MNKWSYKSENGFIVINVIKTIISLISGQQVISNCNRSFKHNNKNSKYKIIKWNNRALKVPYQHN